MGTVLGSVATVIMVPQLANAPELLSLALALWVGFCLFISLLDRTPRSYIFLLAGYTAALIGFPSVNDPSGIFDVALSRVEEISIGIVCGSLVHGLVFPQSWGPIMLGRVSHVIRDIQQTLTDVFAGSERDQLQKDKRMLATDIAELRNLSIHLPFDTSHLRWTAGAIYSMHERLSILLPLLSGIRDRLEQLRGSAQASSNESAMTEWNALLTRIQDWATLSTQDAEKIDQRNEEKRRIEDAIEQLTPQIHAGATWTDLLQLNLARRLTALLRVMDDVLTLYKTIEASATGAFPVLQNQPVRQSSRVTPLHHDYWLACMSAAAAIVAILCCCLFWIETAWPSGSVAAMMAAVFCCLFAVQDDPVPSLKTFLYFTLASVPISAMYVLWILPAAHSFETMALCISPLLFVLGIYLARPQYGLKSLAMTLGVLGSFALQESGAVDVGVFMNATIGQTIGVIAALVFTALIRSVSAGWRANRLVAAGRQELLELTTNMNVPHIDNIAAKMMDRVAQLAPRISAATEPPLGNEPQHIDALLDFRMSLNVVELLNFQATSTPALSAIKPLLQQLRQHFSSTPTSPLSASQISEGQCLLTCLDATIHQLTSNPVLNDESNTDQVNVAPLLNALTALTALRRDLFPDANAYVPLLTPINPVVPTPSDE